MYNPSLMDCPKCKLLNPPSAERCDCGYDFKTGTMQESYLTERDKRFPNLAIGGAIAAPLLILRIALGVTGTGEEESKMLLLLALAIIACTLGIWLAGRKASAQK